MKEPEPAFSGPHWPESLLFDQAKFMGISEKRIRSQGKTTMEGAVKAFLETTSVDRNADFIFCGTSWRR